MMKRLLAATVSLFATLSAPAQDLEQRLDAVREFKRYFPRYKTVPEQVAAVQTLEGMECPEAVEVLLKLLDFRDQEVRNTALEVVGAYRKLATFKVLVEELPAMKDQRKRAQVIEILGNAQLFEALAPIVEIALNDKRASPLVRYHIARAVGQIGHRDGAAALEALLGDPDVLVRMAASDAVGTLQLKGLAPRVVPLLEDKAWQVQSSAVKTLGTLRHVVSVEPLIGLMRKGGRLVEDAADALFRITALDFGADPEMWAKQWSSLQSIGWRIPTDAELAKAVETRKRNDAYYGKAEDTTAFAGIRTTSTRVLFIIDVSGSMDDLVVERDRFDADYADYAKLTIVKTELQRTIENLNKNTIFNIVSFASDLKPWKKYLVPANIINKSSAKSWITRLSPIGGKESVELAAAGLGGSANLAAGKTNTFKALMYPFAIDPAKPARAAMTHGKVSIKNKLDTVFFLSDGRPSTGKLVDTGEILKEVNRINDVFKIVIHSIAIGDFQRAFLRDLARNNGGTFVDLGR